MNNKLDDFPKMSTGNGFANDLTATTNDRLERTVRALIKLEKTNKFEENKTRKTISKLTEMIEGLDKKNEKLQVSIFRLTVVTATLAIVQVLVAMFQLL